MVQQRHEQRCFCPKVQRPQRRCCGTSPGLLLRAWESDEGVGVQREEGVCIGQWNRKFCNHWVSRDALVQYIVTEAEDGRFSFLCPVCRPKRCARCVYHAPSQREEGCCYISPKQIRSVLSEEQMNRLLELQVQLHRTVH